MGQLDGKVAIVTGAGRGIGKAIAVRFAQEGAKVAVVSRTEATVKAVTDEINAAGGEAIGLTCDVAVREQVEAAVKAVTDRFGGVDVLINNAHHTGDMQHAFEDTSIETLRLQWESGFIGTVNFMQLCFPSLKERQGKIVNFGSSVGVRGNPKYAAYAAAKEAIRGASRIAAKEWAKHKINVNIVCPIAVTDGLAEAIKDPQVKAAASMMPLGYPGSAEDDIAPVVLFLSTDASRYITGHTIMVDGGNSIDAGR